MTARQRPGYHAVVAARLRFRVRQLAHDLTTGMLLRPALIAGAIAVAGLVLIELESTGTLPRWTDGGWFFRDDAASARPCSARSPAR